MNALAPDFAASKIHGGHTARSDQRAGEGARHKVEEYGARRKLLPGKRGADDGVVPDIQGDRRFHAARVVEPVGAYAENALGKIQHDPLGLGAVVTARVEAQVSAADQAIHALCGGGFHRRRAGKDNGKREQAYEWGLHV